MLPSTKANLSCPELVLSKTNPCRYSFLVFDKSQRCWIHAIINTLDPAGALKLRARLESNTDAILSWFYSTCVNVNGVMHTLEESSIMQRSADHLAGFLFLSLVVSLMLLETEDLIPVIAHRTANI